MLMTIIQFQCYNFYHCAEGAVESAYEITRTKATNARLRKLLKLLKLDKYQPRLELGKKVFLCELASHYPFYIENALRRSLFCYSNTVM